MPEGFSPEFKRAPDALQGRSESFSRGKPHQPKTEAAPNVPRHPSETFPWLPKEEYFRQRDQYLPTMIPVIEQAIAGSNSKFKYKDDPEKTKTVATLFSRALFVSEYLDAHSPQKYETLIRTHASSHIVNSHISAILNVGFQIGEREIEDLCDVAPTQIDQLILKGIHISFNMNRLGQHVEFIEDMAADALIDKKLPVESVEQQKKQALDEEGIEQEKIMVHEMAHAFYIIKAASNPESLRKYIEDIKNYRMPPTERDEDIPEEELCLYIDAPIEQDAHKWEAAFMQRYYPQELKHERF